MTLSSSEARSLNYSKFFEGLRAIHTDPLVLQSIGKLQEQTQALVKATAGQEEAWRAKLKYMSSLRTGWTDPDLIFPQSVIKSTEELMLELDKFMDTTYVEMESSRDGVLSVYWFTGSYKYQVKILSEETYSLIRTSMVSSERKEYLSISRKKVLKKILDWTTSL